MTLEMLEQRMDALENKLDTLLQQAVRSEEKALSIKVSGILRQLGIPAHIKGYQYLREAIIVTVNNPDETDVIPNLLYPTLTKKFKTTVFCVKHSIFHAIEVAWDRGDADTQQEYFGFTASGTKDKPTNSEFIATIADRIRLEGFK